MLGYSTDQVGGELVVVIEGGEVILWDVSQNFVVCIFVPVNVGYNVRDSPLPHTTVGDLFSYQPSKVSQTKAIGDAGPLVEV